MDNKNIYRVAITGCAGSGKTTTARYLESMGFQVLFADDISRRLLSHKSVIEHLKGFVGDSIIVGDRLNLKYIGGFFDERPEAEAMFENWYQPFLGLQIQKELSKYTSLVFCDIPLLQKKKIAEIFDMIWVLQVDKQKCASRIAARNHYGNKKIDRLLCDSTMEFHSENTIDIYNNDNLKALYSQVDCALRQILD